MLETDSALKVMSRRRHAYAVWPTVKSDLLCPGVRCCCIRQVRIVRLQRAHFCVDISGNFRDLRKLYRLQKIRKTGARVAWAYQLLQFTSLMQIPPHIRQYTVHGFGFCVKKLNIFSEHSFKTFIGSADTALLILDAICRWLWVFNSTFRLF